MKQYEIWSVRPVGLVIGYCWMEEETADAMNHVFSKNVVFNPSRVSSPLPAEITGNMYAELHNASGVKVPGNPA